MTPESAFYAPVQPKPAESSYQFIDREEERRAMAEKAAEIAQEARAEECAGFIFLDKRARPLHYLIREAWQILYPDQPPPPTTFLNIGSELGAVLGEYREEPFHDAFDPSPYYPEDQGAPPNYPVVPEDQEKVAERLGEEHIEWLRERLRRLSSLPEGAHVTVVDEIEFSGNTRYLAEAILTTLFPGLKIHFQSFSHPGKSLFTRQVVGMFGMATSYEPPWSAASTGVIDRPPSNEAELFSQPAPRTLAKKELPAQAVETPDQSDEDNGSYGDWGWDAEEPDIRFPSEKEVANLIERTRRHYAGMDHRVDELLAGKNDSEELLPSLDNSALKELRALSEASLASVYEPMALVFGQPLGYGRLDELEARLIASTVQKAIGEAGYPSPTFRFGVYRLIETHSLGFTWLRRTGQNPDEEALGFPAAVERFKDCIDGALAEAWQEIVDRGGPNATVLLDGLFRVSFILEPFYETFISRTQSLLNNWRQESYRERATTPIRQEEVIQIRQEMRSIAREYLHRTKEAEEAPGSPSPALG